MRPRFDYVRLWASWARRLKDEHPGIGLGSNLSGQDRITLLGEPVTGLVAVQCWALLINMGHLFGTFATERALQYEINRQDDITAQLLDLLPRDLRDACGPLVASRSYSHFHQVLAAIRLGEVEDQQLRAELCALYRLFLVGEPTQRVADLRWALRRAASSPCFRSTICSGSARGVASHTRCPTSVRAYMGVDSSDAHPSCPRRD